MSLHPEGRFEWERIIRRVPLPPNAKLVALLLATYGTRDGTRVRPGVLRLAAVSGLTDRTVRRALARLRRDGLIEEMVSGSRAGTGRCSEYRLTLPEDLIDRGLLDPDEVNQGTPVSPGLLYGLPVDNPDQGTPVSQGRGHSEQDQGTPETEPGDTGVTPSLQDHIKRSPIDQDSSYVSQRARENDGDDEREYAAAERELRRLPDFGMALIEDIRRSLPGDPDHRALVITAGGIARERRRSA